MRVITISREFGSGGSLIAKQIADALGFHLVDKVFISAVLSQYGIVEFDAEYEKMPSFWERFGIDNAERREVMVRMLDRVVRSVALHGNVVVLGRSGFAVLSGFADVFHVRLHAPPQFRAEQVAAQRKIALPAAKILVKDSDQVRTSFVESFYGVSWSAASAFDLVINSAVVPIDVAAGWIIGLAKTQSVKPGNNPTTRQIEVDEVLMETIAQRLSCRTDHA